MFSVRLVSADSYQATPLPQLDPTFSEFRGAEIKHVPIVRVFGTTPTGDKTCLHLHGAFPYMYVPCTGEDNADGFAYRLAASLDAAINISLGSTNSSAQHVYQIQRVAGIPFYGYHRREHQFFKVSFYNPAMMKKAIDLLQNGSVLNQTLQPYEAHIPFILQFMIDYNVHGMSMINLSSVKYRRNTQSLAEFKSSNDSINTTPVDDLDYLPSSVERQSICKLEVDALVSDILNRQDLERGIEINPGLAAIWEEERVRRAHAGLPCDDSQLVNPKSPTRPPYCPTDSDLYQEQRLNRRLQIISQCDEQSSLSSSLNTTVYPAEVNENDELINASNLGTFSGQNLNNTTQHSDDSNIISHKSFELSQDSRHSQMINESCILDSNDLPLVDILMDLARDAEKTECIDNDSILGTQMSDFRNNQDNKCDSNDNGDNVDESDDTLDFNLTCLELDSLSPWDNVEKSPSQLVPTNISVVNNKDAEVNLGDILAQDTDVESQDSEESRLPQLDGAGDLLSSFLESEEEENVKFQEVKRVPESQTTLLDFGRMHISNTRMQCTTDDEATIEEVASSEFSKSDWQSDDYSPTSPDTPWSPHLSINEPTIDHYALTDFVPLGSEFERDYENVLENSNFPSSASETTSGSTNNISVESESIPLEMVLNGDPCFMQTADMDKSDLTELQDQYASLLGSALVPNIYKNSRSSDCVNNYNSHLDFKDKCDQVSSNTATQSHRFRGEKTVCNLSSENVAPNIQDAKIYKTKYNDCKDFSRLHNDNSDYNCNLVARWEELQDLQFIPKRILKKKYFSRSRNQVLRRCPILSDSMMARRRGYFRRGLSNLANKMYPRENNDVCIPSDDSPETTRDSNSLMVSKINENPVVRVSSNKLIPTDRTGTTADTAEIFIKNSWSVKSLTYDSSYVLAASNVIYEESDSKSRTSIENDFSENILRDFYSNDPVGDVKRTLPGVQYSTYLLGENKNLVTPILEDFGEFVNVPVAKNITQNNNNNHQYLSHYSSVRSHSSIPYGIFNHRHCRYSFIRTAFVQDYVFTSDQIWVIEKRKRGCARPLSSTTCTKNCRLPYVLVKKLNIMMDKNSSGNNKKVSLPSPSSTSSAVPVLSEIKNNCVDSTFKNSDFFKSKCVDGSVYDNDNNKSKLSAKTDVTSIDKHLDMKRDADKNLKNNIVFNYKKLPSSRTSLSSTVDDLTFTQSAQITSTQNHLDHQILDSKKNDGPVIIKRIFEEVSQDGTASKKKRSIILKLGTRNSLSIKDNEKSKNHSVETSNESFVQSRVEKKKRGRTKTIRSFNKRMMTESFSENPEIHKTDNSDLLLMSPTIASDKKSPPSLHNQIINCSRHKFDKKKVTTDYNYSTSNEESNLISSSQSESIITNNKRPEIWCSINKKNIDLSFLTFQSDHNNDNNYKNNRKNSTQNSAAIKMRSKPIVIKHVEILPDNYKIKKICSIKKMNGETRKHKLCKAMDVGTISSSQEVTDDGIIPTISHSTINQLYCKVKDAQERALVTDEMVEKSLQFVTVENTIPSHSQIQQFSDFDDTTLDVHLCDSIYEDDVVKSNDIFDNTTSISENAISITDCVNNDNPQQYTSVCVADANFYANNKNYTIDAISQEIPQCLFEDDSISDSSQKKSSDMFIDTILDDCNVLNEKSHLFYDNNDDDNHNDKAVAGLTTTIGVDNLMKNSNSNYSGCELYNCLNEQINRNSNILIDNSLINLTELSNNQSESDEIEEFTPPSSTDHFKLTNRMNLSYDTSSISSRPSSPEIDNLSNCSDCSNTNDLKNNFDDEDKIAKMIESMLVLSDGVNNKEKNNNNNNNNVVNNCNNINNNLSLSFEIRKYNNLSSEIYNIYKNDNDDEGVNNIIKNYNNNNNNKNNNNNNLTCNNNTNKTSMTTKSKYSQNKISIIRKIYLPKTKVPNRGAHSKERINKKNNNVNTTNKSSGSINICYHQSATNRFMRNGGFINRSEGVTKKERIDNNNQNKMNSLRDIKQLKLLTGTNVSEVGKSHDKENDDDNTSSSLDAIFVTKDLNEIKRNEERQRLRNSDGRCEREENNENLLNEVHDESRKTIAYNTDTDITATTTTTTTTMMEITTNANDIKLSDTQKNNNDYNNDKINEGNNSRIRNDDEYDDVNNPMKTFIDDTIALYDMPSFTGIEVTVETTTSGFSEDNSCEPTPSAVYECHSNVLMDNQQLQFIMEEIEKNGDRQELTKKETVQNVSNNSEIIIPLDELNDDKIEIIDSGENSSNIIEIADSVNVPDKCELDINLTGNDGIKDGDNNINGVIGENNDDKKSTKNTVENIINTFNELDENRSCVIALPKSEFVDGKTIEYTKIKMSSVENVKLSVVNQQDNTLNVLQTDENHEEASRDDNNSVELPELDILDDKNKKVTDSHEILELNERVSFIHENQREITTGVKELLSPSESTHNKLHFESFKEMDSVKNNNLLVDERNDNDHKSNVKTVACDDNVNKNNDNDNKTLKDLPTNVVKNNGVNEVPVKSIFDCKEVSVRLVRMDVNGIKHHLGNNKSVESSITSSSKSIIKSNYMNSCDRVEKLRNNDEEKKLKKSTLKKFVRFNEEVFVCEFNQRVPLIDFEEKEREQERMARARNNEIQIDNDDEINDHMLDNDSESCKSVKQIIIPVEEDKDKIEEVEEKKEKEKIRDVLKAEEIVAQEVENAKESEHDYGSKVKINPFALNKNECKKLAIVAIKEERNFNCNRDNFNNLSQLSGAIKSIKYSASCDTSFICSISNSRCISEALETSARKQKNIRLTGDNMNPNKTLILKKKVSPVTYGKKYHHERKFNVTECNRTINDGKIDTVNLYATREMHISSINKVDKVTTDTFTTTAANTINITPTVHPTSIDDKDNTAIIIKTKTSNKQQCPIKEDFNKSINEFTVRRAELSCKRKRNVLPKQSQLNLNTTKNDIAFVNSSVQEVCEKRKLGDNNRLLHTYRMLTSYRNKVHTLSIDQRMVFTRVTISNQEFHRKTAKEEFLESIGLYPLKSRGCGWQPEHTTTGFIQLQQPRVILQRLTPGVLKHYGYTRRFKSNKLGKRFKMDVNRFTIPAYDGAADLSSSDSDVADTDMTLESMEKRICVYRQRTNTVREAIVTPKKRKNTDDNDESAADSSRTNAKVYVDSKRQRTPRQGITSLRNVCRSPSTPSTSTSAISALKSPGLSGNYSPLKIIVTSPKVHTMVNKDAPQSRCDNHQDNSDLTAISMCVTPRRRRTSQLHENLMRGRITTSLSTAASHQQGNNCDGKTIVKQQLPGELNILDIPSTSICDVDRIFPTSVDEYPCVHKSQDVLSNVKNSTNVRKNLFPSIEDNLRVSASCVCNEMIEQHEDHVHKRADQQNDKDEPVVTVEFSDDEDTVIFEQSTGELKLKCSPSPSKHNYYGEHENDDDDLCNVTFTQYLSSQITKQQPVRASYIDPNQETLSQRLCTIIPKVNPPSLKKVIETMETYGISMCKNLQPFFSIQSDAPGYKELAHKMLKVPGKGLADLPIFRSSLENITGINRWRRMKVNEFHQSSDVFKSSNIRQNLAGHSSVVITPLVQPPTSKSVIKWIRARNYLSKKHEKEVNEAKHEIEKIKRNIAQKSDVELEKNNVKTKIQDEKFNNLPIDVGRASEDENIATLNSSGSSIIEASPEEIVESNLSKVLSRKSSIISKKCLFSDTSDVEKSSSNAIQNYLKMKTTQCSEQNYSHDGVEIRTSVSQEPSTAAESLLSILDKSYLFKENEQSKYYGLSYGQIECATNPNRSNVSNENRQKAKALITYQFITILCVEVHVVTREDLLPDPQHDSVSALFYAVQSDVPPTSNIKPLEHGVIAISNPGESKLGYLYGSTLPFTLTVVSNEEELFNAFIDLVIRIDPEIFIGWEIESLSWGYVFQRASRLGINLSKRISRIPSVQCKWESREVDLDALAEIKLPGRIVLDIWRIMRSELALLNYTFENVMYHVMNERLPCPSFKSLTSWWESKQPRLRWKVVQHYSIKVLGILRILEQLDIIGRTSEHARLFGIQFYEVFSRGSQYRVESIMLRLAKPLNYIAVSPSPMQRASMRAMEALPLIMEPESMFYSDPVIVLDFQSLYPSIIIAHNYCFSTCLGRIEHIGQSNLFEFGAHVLRITKNTALRLQDKVNYTPCGVAFVKPDVRMGILPRMLMEILETRFMVKKAMKDQSQDDKLLQRVLHSRQHGLKYLANVTYGYTAANFSGRMPCIELGDSVISKAKETLERAIKLVESTPRWGGRVVYGDTDSLFILVPGKSKNDAFKIGNEIADAVTSSNLTPIKLKFEKVLYPAILQTKKRYCGYMYETQDQKEPTFLAKGIETVRRDGCPAVSKILEKSLKILFDSKDVSQVKKYVVRQLDKVLSGKVSIQELTFAKEFRGMKGYKEKACVPALELTRRLMKKDPRAIPRRGERVRYIIVAGAPNQALIHCVRSPWELINDPGLRPNGTYYVTRVIIPPLNRCFNLMGVDINGWYKEMPHRHILENPVAIPNDRQKQTIFQYFGTIICVACGGKSNRGICDECISNPTDTLIILHEKLRRLEQINDQIIRICQSCIGRGNTSDCCSLDCPVLYRRVQAQRELTQGIQIRRIIEIGDNLEF